MTPQHLMKLFSSLLDDHDDDYGWTFGGIGGLLLHMNILFRFKDMIWSW